MTRTPYTIFSVYSTPFSPGLSPTATLLLEVSSKYSSAVNLFPPLNSPPPPRPIPIPIPLHHPPNSSCPSLKKDPGTPRNTLFVQVLLYSRPTERLQSNNQSIDRSSFLIPSYNYSVFHLRHLHTLPTPTYFAPTYPYIPYHTSLPDHTDLFPRNQPAARLQYAFYSLLPIILSSSSIPSVTWDKASERIWRSGQIRSHRSAEIRPEPALPEHPTPNSGILPRNLPNHHCRPRDSLERTFSLLKDPRPKYTTGSGYRPRRYQGSLAPLT